MTRKCLLLFHLILSVYCTELSVAAFLSLKPPSPRAVYPNKIIPSNVKAPQRSGNFKLLARKEDDNVLISLVDSVSRVSSTPTSGLSDLPLVYPLVLATSALFLPGTTTALLVSFFALYRWLANTALGEMDEDEEEGMPPRNVLALLASILSTGLLAPSSPTTFSLDLVPQIVALSALLLAAGIFVGKTEEHVQEPEPPEKGPEQLRMDLWDQELENSGQRKSPRKDK